jgi:hypothetical protein
LFCVRTVCHCYGVAQKKNGKIWEKNFKHFFKLLIIKTSTCYWLGPCCATGGPMPNYSQPGFLPSLSTKIPALWDYIRDSLLTRRAVNFRVLCLNRLLGISPRPEDMPYTEASALAALWGRGSGTTCTRSI